VASRHEWAEPGHRAERLDRLRARGGDRGERAVVGHGLLVDAGGAGGVASPRP
jgi:hypothetical protein